MITCLEGRFSLLFNPLTQTLKLRVQTHCLRPPRGLRCPPVWDGAQTTAQWRGESAAPPMLVPMLPFRVASQPGGPTRLQSLSRPRRASLRLSIMRGLAVARVPRRAQEVRLLGAGVTAPLLGISRACGPEAEMGGRTASAVPERPDLMRCVCLHRAYLHPVFSTCTSAFTWESLGPLYSSRLSSPA